MRRPDPNITIVVPCYNEGKNLSVLLEAIEESLAGQNFELIFVDDASNDESFKHYSSLAKEKQNIKYIRLVKNCGQQFALKAGIDYAQGDVIITMDADLQDSPEEIPELYRMISEDGFDLVSGWKKKRFDPLSKTIPSRFFNRTVRICTGIKLHDFNCGLKAYRSEVVKSIELFGEMHRYIPVIAKQAGFKRIGEKVVQHQERKYGVTKFGFERFINGFLDLFTVIFVTRFGKKPMHLFGTLGTLMFLLGGGIAMWIVANKLYSQFNQLKYRAVTDQPLFYIALAMTIIGVLLFIAGFLGELISRSSADRNLYLVEKEI